MGSRPSTICGLSETPCQSQRLMKYLYESDSTFAWLVLILYTNGDLDMNFSFANTKTSVAVCEGLPGAIREELRRHNIGSGVFHFRH